MKKLSLVLLVALYVGAGINHFWHPQFYINIIPPYLPHPGILNIAAGIIEIMLGVMAAFVTTRKFACYAIVAMLIAFLPAHVYTIQKSHCTGNSICLEFAIAWIRLFIIHPFLIAWPVYIKNRTFLIRKSQAENRK